MLVWGYWDRYRLSLGNTSFVAVTVFLNSNPQIMRAALCLDNDEAGQTVAIKTKEELAADKRFAHINISINLPSKGKDYNDTLLQAIRLEQDDSQQDTGVLL